MDWSQLTRELVRALRGRRSQAVLSKRLGHRTNVLYAWESGRNAPTAAQLLELAARSGVDVRAALLRFFRVPPPTLLQAAGETEQTVLGFLMAVRGELPIAELSRQSGSSRFALTRIYKGNARAKAPEFLQLVEVCTHRLLDFLALLVDPSGLPSVRDAWRRQLARRETATHAPWSPAVVAALDLADYRALPQHDSLWLALRLGVEPEQVEQCLSLLVATEQVTQRGKHFVPGGIEAVELSEDRELAKTRREFWGRVAVERAKRSQGMSAYNVCGVSHEDLKRLKELQREYLARARAIIAESKPVEAVALLQVHVIDLSSDRQS
jgi:hypothetical protein